MSQQGYFSSKAPYRITLYVECDTIKTCDKLLQTLQTSIDDLLGLHIVRVDRRILPKGRASVLHELTFDQYQEGESGQ